MNTQPCSLKMVISLASVLFDYSQNMSTGTSFVSMLSRNFLYFCIICFCAIISYTPCDSLKLSNVQCKLFHSCQCIFPNHLGIDLFPLNQKSQWLNTTRNNQTFYFHPCSDLSLGIGTDCSSGASVCLFSNSTQSYTNLGFANETTVVSSGVENPIQLKYKHKDTETIIHLKCDREETSLTVQSSSKPNHYELILNSPVACLQHILVGVDPVSTSSLSAGSLLVIIFIVFSGLYFLGGALALKCLRGAEGREMIPNLDFWTSLPGLVREGFLFTINGCQPAPAYDRI